MKKYISAYSGIGFALVMTVFAVFLTVLLSACMDTGSGGEGVTPPPSDPSLSTYNLGTFELGNPYPTFQVLDPRPGETIDAFFDIAGLQGTIVDITLPGVTNPRTFEVQLDTNTLGGDFWLWPTSGGALIDDQTPIIGTATLPAGSGWQIIPPIGTIHACNEYTQSVYVYNTFTWIAAPHIDTFVVRESGGAGLADITGTPTPNTFTFMGNPLSHPAYGATGPGGTVEVYIEAYSHPIQGIPPFALITTGGYSTTPNPNCSAGQIYGCGKLGDVETGEVWTAFATIDGQQAPGVAGITYEIEYEDQIAAPGFWVSPCGATASSSCSEYAPASETTLGIKCTQIGGPAPVTAYTTIQVTEPPITLPGSITLWASATSFAPGANVTLECREAGTAVALSGIIFDSFTPISPGGLAVGQLAETGLPISPPHDQLVINSAVIAAHCPMKSYVVNVLCPDPANPGSTIPKSKVVTASDGGAACP
ncbi:hypothetical protein ACFLRA_01335 [Bdellovibrionota bacterium]